MSASASKNGLLPNYYRIIVTSPHFRFALHSFQVMLVATVVLYLSRSIGTLSTTFLDPRVLIHCTVVVAVAYPLQTVFAVSLMFAFEGKLPRAASAILGCSMAALPTAVLCPTINWVLGVLPVPVGAVETRAEFVSFVEERFLTILASFMVLGSILWMSLNYRWWSDRIGQKATKLGSVDRALVLPPIDEAVGEDLNTREASYLIKKMPPDKRGEIIALSAEQHYVRVFTEKGNDLVLTSFSEAVASLPEDEGMRIHRSHWVNKKAIQQIRPQGSRMFVELLDRLELPVSRSFSGAVREAFPELMA